MLLKKSTIALCSSGSLSSTLSLPASITSSNSCPPATATTTTTTPPPSTATCLRPRRKKLDIPTQWLRSRSYATIRNDGKHESPDPRSDRPEPAWPNTKHPTPYEIFDQSRSAPYSKKTFYQLVKLYHPDRHGHGPHSSTLSHATKLERYRLVVAANTILSDPSRRRAYDLYGAGWAGAGDMSNASYREADRAWRREAGSAAGNATWEDWERWHERRAGATASNRRQEPVYMSNGLFVAVLAVFVVIGSWGQATRAGSRSVQLLDMRETTSNNISEDMWRRRREKAVLSRQDRVENFLRQREGWGPGPGAGSESHLPKD